MTEKSRKTLLGLTPVRYGTVSLIAACLAFASQWLVVAVGVFLFLVVLIPLLLIGVVSGLLGVGAGIYYKDWLACVTATLGLGLVGLLGWLFISNLNNF